MRRLIIFIGLLLLSSPAYPCDLPPEVQKAIQENPFKDTQWTHGKMVEGEYRTPGELAREREKPHHWQHKTIPESSLEEYLNNGWEFVKGYSIVVSGGTRFMEESTTNKAIVRRRVR